MKTIYTPLLVEKRTKRMLTGLILAVALFFPHQDATAGQAPVFLGSAGSFVALAGTTITSTSGSTINGDVGVWPGSTFVDAGAIVNGTVYLADPIAKQAQGELTTAYNDAAGRTLDVIVYAGELGGKTLAPGLYKSAPGSFAITSVDLTLDAQGDPDAVWIFQMASTLVVENGRQVILTGGAQAGNIFWQVGSSATLGTTSTVKGNILAYTAISIKTNATLDGRALARNAAVTLEANTLTRPPLTPGQPGRIFRDQPWRLLLMNREN